MARLLILLICLAAAPLLAAADGESNPLEDSWRVSDWVALVTVDSRGNLVNPALSQVKGVFGVQGYWYAVTQQKYWKGESRDSFKLRVYLSDCPVELTPGTDYIVFGRADDQGNRRADHCDNLIALADAEYLLPHLDQLHQVETAQRLNASTP